MEASRKPAERYPGLSDALGRFRGPVLNGKKKEIVKWLEERAQHLLRQAEPHHEGLRLLYVLLKLIGDSDGKLFQSANMVDTIAKQLLNLDITALSQLSFDNPSHSQTSMAAYEEHRALGELRGFLAQGQREKALELAMQHSLWAHAFIIASGLSKPAFNSAVQSFVAGTISAGDPLAAAYSMFAGVTCNFDSSVAGAERYWKENLLTLLSNRNCNDDPTCFLQLGDHLARQEMECEASICYLLSGWPLDGIDSVNGRLALLGCVHSMNPLHFFSDLQSILLTEVYEYLLRLQNSSFILPYFQPFKLYIALVLADYGYVEESQKYCESIMSLVKSYGKDTPYFHRQFFNQLKDLTERLSGSTGNTSSSEASSWLSKAPIQGLFSAFDRGITKFISGTDVAEMPAATADSSKSEKSPVGGGSSTANITTTAMYSSGYQDSQYYSTNPGSVYQYSTGGSVYQYQQQQQFQSPSPPQNAISPQQQQQQQPYDPYNNYSYGGQYNNPWAVDQPSVAASQQQQQQQAVNETSQAAFGQPQSYSYQNLPSYSNYDPYGSGYGTYYSNAPTDGQDQTNSVQYQQFGSDYQQPGTFSETNQDYVDATNSSGVYQYNQQPQQQQHTENADFDDLGFGNSSLSRSKSTIDRPATTAPQEQQNNPQTDANDGGNTDEGSRTEITESSYMAIIRGFGSLFRRESTRSSNNSNTVGPVTAKLGEKSKFRYDEAQKKWVMDSDDGSAAAAAPTTPSKPPTGGGPSRPPIAPPSTPISQSVNVSRAPSPAPVIPGSYGGSGGTDAGTFVPPDTPSKRASLRKPARSRYVDPLNPTGADQTAADDPSMNRSVSASFLPPPTMATSGASVPRIMTPGPAPKQQQQQQ